MNEVSLSDKSFDHEMPVESDRDMVEVRPETWKTSRPLNGDDMMGPTGEVVLSELIRQIPTLTGREALPLAQMITDQLRRWSWQAPVLTFRRTKITEHISHASVTLVDFECRTENNLAQTDAFDTGRLCYHRYISTLVMSEIADPDDPELRLSCLWAPAFEGKEGTTFEKESRHILSVFNQCSGTGNDFRGRLASALGSISIGLLYEKYFDDWEPRFVSAAAAIQRACAWGIVAAKSTEIEYRLFAASLRCYLHLQIQRNLQFQEKFNFSSDDGQRDLSYELIPFIKVSDTEIGSP